MRSLSASMEFLYFPIKAREYIPSRALAYLVQREHNTVARQLHAMYGKELVNGEHVHDYHKNGKHVTFKVWSFHLTHDQFIGYLLKYPNVFQKQLADQLKQGLKQSELIVNHSKVSYA